MPVSKHRHKKPRRKPSQKPIPAQEKPSLAKVIPVPSEIIGAHRSVNLTKNGKCSNCGACCPSVLPVTQAERLALKEYAEANHINPRLPLLPRDLIYLQCPFLDKKHHKCLVYPVRPAICRAYRCDRSDLNNLVEYCNLTGLQAVPARFNLWELFGKTGLRADGEELTLENAARAELVDDKRLRYPIQVGRPLSFKLKDGTKFDDAVCLGIFDTTIHVIDHGKVHKIETLDIDEINPMP